jgi:hypothetical protein
LAGAIYLRLPAGVQLWLRGQEFVSVDTGRLGGMS